MKSGKGLRRLKRNRGWYELGVISLGLRVAFIFLWIHSPIDEGNGSKTAKSPTNNENDQFQDAEQGEKLNQNFPQIAKKSKHCHIHI